MIIYDNRSSKLYGAAYIRYSSTMQDDSFSLEAQLRQIKIRAASEGVEIIKVYSDPATSAYKTRYRPAITEMLGDIKNNQFSILYVHKVDRLARRLEWCIEIVHELQKYNVTLKAVEQSFDLDTPEGKLMFHLLGSLGEFYSNNLSQETHKGKYERAQQGYHNGWVSWGYKSEKIDEHMTAVPDTNLAKVVYGLFEHYATGLYYDQDMADWLNEQGCQTRLGRIFTKDAVRDILQNPFYKGYILYRGTYAYTRKTRRKQDGELVKGLHTPIIDEKLFDKCQRVRMERRNQGGSGQITLHNYLLTGIITCKECGHRMRAHSTKNGRYYRESSRFTGIKCSCEGKGIRADYVEFKVSDFMVSLLLPSNWLALLQEHLQLQKIDSTSQQERTRLLGEIRRMREAYKRGLYENDEPAFWREIENLQRQLRILELITPYEISKAGSMLEELQKTWSLATVSKKAELCHAILKQVVFDFGTRDITKMIPKPEYEILFSMAVSENFKSIIG